MGSATRLYRLMMSQKGLFDPTMGEVDYKRYIAYHPAGMIPYYIDRQFGRQRMLKPEEKFIKRMIYLVCNSFQGEGACGGFLLWFYSS